MTEINDGLAVPKVFINPQDRFSPESRIWQGIAGIECASSGRLWATWYTGERFEMPGNYALLAYSDDGGESWHDPAVVIYPAAGARICDPCIWIDPEGKLWFFFNQSGENEYHDGRAGVWAITSENHESESPEWSKPFRIFHGIMLNKPIVTSSKEWLLPVSIWTVFLHGKPLILKDEVKPYAGAGVVASTDNGKNWEWRGAVNIPCASYDEHMLIEKNDKTLWLLARTLYGIGQSESHDGGRTWSRGRATELDGPDSRFYIRRLQSGNLILVNHHNFADQENQLSMRCNLTAFLSRDDGKSWEGGLLLDERSEVSYPDGCQTEDGMIYIAYDHQRGGMRLNLNEKEFEKRKNHSREILMAQFREEDILAGKCVSIDAVLKKTISCLGPKSDFTIEKFLAEGGIDWQDDMGNRDGMKKKFES
ncbi:MAG: sialidase family protein [Planctomycetota bacterium]|jgi:hypothetical protein